MCHRIHEESETSKTIADNTRSKERFVYVPTLWPKWISKYPVQLRTSEHRSIVQLRTSEHRSMYTTYV